MNHSTTTYAPPHNHFTTTCAPLDNHFATTYEPIDNHHAPEMNHPKTKSLARQGFQK
jgi:hypothetical protein